MGTAWLISPGVRLIGGLCRTCRAHGGCRSQARTQNVLALGLFPKQQITSWKTKAQLWAGLEEQFGDCQATFITLPAWGPFCPSTISNSTWSPS